MTEQRNVTPMLPDAGQAFPILASDPLPRSFPCHAPDSPPHSSPWPACARAPQAATGQLASRITFCSFIRHYFLLFHYFLLVSGGIFRQRSAQLCSKHTTKDSPQSSRPSDEQSHCNSLCRRTTSQQPIRTRYIATAYADALHCNRLCRRAALPPASPLFASCLSLFAATAVCHTRCVACPPLYLIPVLDTHCRSHCVTRCS